MPSTSADTGGAQKVAVKTAEQPAMITAIEWLPADTGVFVSACMRRHVSVWQTELMCRVDRLTLANNPTCVTWQRQTRVGCIGRLARVTECVQLPLLAICQTNCNHVQLYDVRSASNTHQLRGHKTAATVCAWSPQTQNQLVSGIVNRGCVRTICIQVTSLGDFSYGTCGRRVHNCTRYPPRLSVHRLPSCIRHVVVIYFTLCMYSVVFTRSI
jgi:WD40 repeat protein